jgi:hypothetical protein
MAKTQVTIPISERALVQRINRKLAEDDRRLMANRGANAKAQFGRYCVVSGRSRHLYIHDQDVDLQALARHVGVIANWERLG